MHIALLENKNVQNCYVYGFNHAIVRHGEQSNMA